MQSTNIITYIWDHIWTNLSNFYKKVKFYTVYGRQYVRIIAKYSKNFCMEKVLITNYCILGNNWKMGKRIWKLSQNSWTFQWRILCLLMIMRENVSSLKIIYKFLSLIQRTSRMIRFCIWSLSSRQLLIHLCKNK